MPPTSMTATVNALQPEQIFFMTLIGCVAIVFIKLLLKEVSHGVVIMIALSLSILFLTAGVRLLYDYQDLMAGMPHLAGAAFFSVVMLVEIYHIIMNWGRQPAPKITE